MPHLCSLGCVLKVVVLLEGEPSGRPALERVLVVPNFFHLRMIEASVFLWTFNAAEFFWNLSPDLCLDTILSQSSPDNSFDLIAWFLF